MRGLSLSDLMETCTRLSPHAAENLIRKMDELESRLAKIELQENSQSNTQNEYHNLHQTRGKQHRLDILQKFCHIS